MASHESVPASWLHDHDKGGGNRVALCQALCHRPASNEVDVHMLPNQQIDSRDWLLLIGLSVMWGASFFFNGVSLRELPPMTIVFLRVALAAAILFGVTLIYRVALPRSVSEWLPFVAMAALNNIIPFSLVVVGQAMIASGLAAIANATTPLFTVIIMAVAREEPLLPRRVLGVVIGLSGVVILQGGVEIVSSQNTGILLCLAASVSYGLSALYARRRLMHVPPLAAATSQLMASTLMMAFIVLAVDRPWEMTLPGLATVLAVVGSASFSTALAYVVFFQIIKRSGSTNVMLVTLLIPVTAVMLGTLLLGETIRPIEVVGALVIAGALLIIDGRLLGRLRPTRTPAG